MYNGSFMDVTKKILLAAACTLLFYGTVLRFSIAVHRSYQVDEVEHIHSSYDVHQGKVLYRDFLESHPPLLYVVLQPLIRPDDPPATFLACRLLMFGVTVAMVALVFRITASFFTTATGLSAAVLLTFVTTFAERGIEVRPDPWMALLTLLAFWFEIHGDETKDSILSALTLSIAFLFTPKVVGGSLIIGVCWVLKAVRKRKWSAVLTPLAVFLIPIALSLVYFWRLGALEPYFTRCFWNMARFVARQVPTKESVFNPVPFVLQESGRNLIFSISAIIGILLLFTRCHAFKDRSSLKLLRNDWATQKQFLLPVAGLLSMTYVWTNPFPFPYSFVPILPFLSITAAWLLQNIAEKVFQRDGSWALVYAAIVTVLILILALPRILEKGKDSNSYQMAMLREIQSITDKNDSVMDLTGLYFRPDGYFSFCMTGIQLELYKMGAMPLIIPQLTANQTVAVMSNYRVLLLPEKELSFLQNHYVHSKGNVLVQGCDLVNLPAGGKKIFEVMKQKQFRYIGPVGALNIDGRSFQDGVLTQGRHLLEAVAPIPQGTLIMNPPGSAKPDQRPQSLYVNFD